MGSGEGVSPVMIRVQDLSRLGYKQVGKSTRFLGPHGETYDRAIMGNPSVCVVNLDGSKVFLAVVKPGVKT